MIEHSVLIIDDDPWMQRVFSKILIGEGFKKYYAANDGYSGIGMAIEHKPTLIILDIVMPELNGCQVLKLIKYIKDIRDIPIIIASSTPNPVNISVAMKLGASGFLVKPFSSATLRNKLLSIFGEIGMSLIREGKTLGDLSKYADKNNNDIDDEFDIDSSDEFDIDSFKMKTHDMTNISIPGEKTATQKVSSNINQDVLKVHYQTEKEQNAKELEEMLGKFKYKD